MCPRGKHCPQGFVHIKPDNCDLGKGSGTLRGSKSREVLTSRHKKKGYSDIAFVIFQIKTASLCVKVNCYEFVRALPIAIV